MTSFRFNHALTIACPFCGSRAIRAFEVDIDKWAMCCAQCQTTGPHASTEDQAVARWLTRPAA